MENLLPTLDLEVLQQRTNEAAMKGALQAIDDYYTGYNSPFKRAISERLEATTISGTIDLPDIITLINEKLGKELDQIASTAVSKTFIPQLSRILLRQPKEVKFSDILKEFISAYELSADDGEYASVEIKKSDFGDHLNAKISGGDHEHTIALHVNWDNRHDATPKRQLLSLPNRYSSVFDRGEKMKLILPEERAELELPFSRSVLDDKFCRYIASLVIGRSVIEMDCEDFDESMFNQDDEY